MTRSVAGDAAGGRHGPAEAESPMGTDFRTFDVVRDMEARPQTVWRAWTEPALRRRWFAWEGDPDWRVEAYRGGVAEGGTEHGRFAHDRVGTFSYDARYILLRRPGERPGRIVYSYTMAGATGVISVSQATVTVAAAGAGTRLVYTEQAVFLDGGDKLESRLAGCESLMDRLALVVAEGAVA